MRRAVFTKPALSGGGEAEQLACHPLGAIRRPSGRRFRVGARLVPLPRRDEAGRRKQPAVNLELVALRRWALGAFGSVVGARRLDDVSPRAAAPLGHLRLRLLFCALLCPERTDPIEVVPGDREAEQQGHLRSPEHPEELTGEVGEGPFQRSIGRLDYLPTAHGQAPCGRPERDPLPPRQLRRHCCQRPRAATLTAWVDRDEGDGLTKGILVGLMFALARPFRDQPKCVLAENDQVITLLEVVPVPSGHEQVTWGLRNFRTSHDSTSLAVVSMYYAYYTLLMEYRGIPIRGLRIDSVEWTGERAEHIRTRTSEPEWATEAALDILRLAGPAMSGESLQVVGFSTSCGRVLKVWLYPKDLEAGEWYGASACEANDTNKRPYGERKEEQR
jgi:hypothetical protein